MASGTDMLSSEDRIDIELDATVKFYKVINCIEKWQIASCQIPDDIYEADSEDNLSEAESLQSILINAYLHLEASVVCEVSRAAKNMKAKLMEELTYEINYLQSITLKKTDVENAQVPSDIIALRNVEVVEPDHAEPKEFDSSYRSTTEQHIALVERERIKRTDLSSVTNTVEPNRPDDRTTAAVNTELSCDTVTKHTPPQAACSSISLNMQSSVDDTKSSINVAIYCNEAQQQIVEQKTVSSDSITQIELSTVPIRIEVHGYEDNITTVDNATPVHVTPAITVDEEAIAFAITRYDGATTEIMEQICTATEASTNCTEQFNITLPVADAPLCDHDHTTELLPQATDTDPAAIHTQLTMLQNPESNSTSQIRMDSDTEEQTDDRKFCFQQYDRDDINKTWRSTSIVQSCYHSDNSCDIFFLLLYS